MIKSDRPSPLSLALRPSSNNLTFDYEDLRAVLYKRVHSTIHNDNKLWEMVRGLFLLVGVPLTELHSSARRLRACELDGAPDGRHLDPVRLLPSWPVRTIPD